MLGKVNPDHCRDRVRLTGRDKGHMDDQRDEAELGTLRNHLTAAAARCCTGSGAKLRLDVGKQ